MSHTPILIRGFTMVDRAVHNTIPLVEIRHSKAFWRLTHHPRLFAGGLILSVIVVVALIAPLLALPNPERGKSSLAYQAPSAEHWLGMDAVGRDMLARVFYGARVSLLVS